MKIWNGTAMVEPKDFKVWNGSAFVQPKGIHAWVGGVFKKLWPNGIARQRVDKSGTFSQGFTNDELVVTGWVSNATYPGTVADDKLVVSTGGQATVTFSATRSATSTQRAYRNGVLLGTLTGSGSTVTRTDTINLAQGDVLHITNQGTLSSITAGYIEVAPT